MGIHPYGLFGTTESNNSFGRDYELRRQLSARQGQLDALNNKKELNSDDEKLKVMLTNAVNQLSTRIDKINNPTTLPKQQETASPASNITARNAASIAAVYSSSDGTVVNKTQSPKTSNPDYLKGFFVDLKI